MYAHNDENTNCEIVKQTHIDHNFSFIRARVNFSLWLG